MNVVSLLAPYFEPYITIHGIVPGCSYSYAKHGVESGEVLDFTMHRPKVSANEWLYVVTPANARLEALDSGSRLYVGCETSDRMFRGKRSDGVALNLHHREMRKGKGGENLVSFLRTRGDVRVHLIGKHSLARATREVSKLTPLQRLLDEPELPRVHAGTRFESAILHHEYEQWAWNTQHAHSGVVSFLRSQGLAD